MQDQHPPETAEQVDPKRWWILVILCLSLVIIIVGNTVLNVALPTLVRELDATDTDLQWIVDSYALLFAGLLLSFGALGDRYGRKGALQLGLAIFGAASLGAAFFANEPAHLIFWRSVMGIGAAFVMPATLSILTVVFPARERQKAIAIWAGLAGAGAAIGPVASGFLLEVAEVWWGAIFLVNVPIVLLALIAGHFLVPKSKDPAQEPLDPFGALLSMAGFAALLYAIIEAPLRGWTDPVVVGFGAASLVVLALFGVWELRARYPMLDLRFFRDAQFSASVTAIMLVFFALFGTFFLLAQYLQLVIGYDAFKASLSTLPMPGMMILVAPQSARLAAKFGNKKVVTTGLMLTAAGLAYSSSFGIGTDYWRLVIGFVVLAGGMSLTMAPATAGIMSSVPLGKAGVGSAVNDTTRELGGAFGVAVLGSLLTSGYRSGVESIRDLGDPIDASLGAAIKFSLEDSPQFAGRVIPVAQQSFVDALGISMLVGAGVVFVAAVVVFKFMPAHFRQEHHRTGGAEEPTAEPDAVLT